MNNGVRTIEKSTYGRMFGRSERNRRLVVTSFLLIASAGGALAESPRIPLCPGLQVVTAVKQANGDYESIKTVEAVDASGVRLHYASESVDKDMLSAHFGKVVKTDVQRIILPEDLASSTFYAQKFFTGMPSTIPGATAIGVSATTLEALRSRQETMLSISNAYSGEPGIDRNVRPNIYDYVTPALLNRLDGEPVLLDVLVNDVPARLPAIHVGGDFAGEKSEFWFLDDLDNPLTLKFRIGRTKDFPFWPTSQSAESIANRALCVRRLSCELILCLSKQNRGQR